jgi:hypothetical protein
MDWQKLEKIVPELPGEIAALRASQSAAQGAARNRAASNNSATAVTAVTNGMALNYAAILIQARVSGLFAVSVAFAYSGATAAASSTLAITTQTSAGAITLGNATAVGAPNGTNPMTAGSAPGVFVASAAAGVTVSAGGGGIVTQSTEVFTSPTAGTTGLYSWSGLIHNAVATGAFVPFTIGNFVAILFNLNAGTSNWSITSLSVQAQELVA